MVYVDLVMLLNFLVDYFLLLGTNRLCGYPSGWGRTAIGAAVGGIYGGMCLVPGFRFLGNNLWKLVSLCAISLISFGVSRSALRRGVVFSLLSMALGGIALGFEGTGGWALVASAAAIAVLCAVGLRGRIGAATYVPVDLSYEGKRMHLIALQDTGNALRDPVTGRAVLVIGGDAAQQLTGLTQQQLRDPVLSMLSPPISGLRLIPYRTVGQPGGMLLALRLQDVKIGDQKGSCLVAFAPERLSAEGAYQALTGGTV